MKSALSNYFKTVLKFFQEISLKNNFLVFPLVKTQLSV